MKKNTRPYASPQRLRDHETRYRKFAQPKTFPVRFRYVGKVTEGNVLEERMRDHGFLKRYETERAAQDAIDAWRAGRGVLANICSGPDGVLVET